MKRFFLLLSTIFLLFSCANSNDDLPNFHYELLPIDQADIPTTLNYEEEYDITFTYTLPNGCYHYNNLFYQTKDSIRTIAVVAFVNDDTNCTEALITEEKTFKLKVSQKEDYIFKLWKGKNDQDEDIYEEIITKVLEPGEQL